MFTDLQGPIEQFEWGRFQIRGKVHSMDGEGAGKDIYLIGDQVQPWAVRKGHKLKPWMVAAALGEAIEILVIGNGVNGAIKLTKKTHAAIKAAGINRLIVQETPQACETYNRLYWKGKRVALLAHGTC